MGKVQIVSAAVLLILQTSVLAAPEIKDGGVNAGNFTENRILDARTTWMSHPEQWMVFWGKIEPRSDYDGDSQRYYAKIEFISPDNTLKIKESPVAFDADGTAKIFKSTSYFVDAKTPEVQKPFVFGRWTSNLYIFDEKTGESTLTKTVSFEIMESRPLALPSTSSEAFPAETGTPETTYIEIEKSDADKANEEEVKKLKAELEEIKKLLEKKNEKPAKKTRAKTSLKKTAAKKDAKKTK